MTTRVGALFVLEENTFQTHRHTHTYASRWRDCPTQSNVNWTTWFLISLPLDLSYSLIPAHPFFPVYINIQRSVSFPSFLFFLFSSLSIQLPPQITTHHLRLTLCQGEHFSSLLSPTPTPPFCHRSTSFPCTPTRKKRTLPITSLTKVLCPFSSPHIVPILPRFTLRSHRSSHAMASVTNSLPPFSPTLYFPPANSLEEQQSTPLNPQPTTKTTTYRYNHHSVPLPTFFFFFCSPSPFFCN